MRRPSSAYGVVIRGATSMALLMEGLWIVGDPLLWPVSSLPLPLRAACVVVISSWVALLVAHLVGNKRSRRVMRPVNVGALVLATSVALVLSVGGGSLEADAAIDLALLTSAIAGLLLPFRAGVAVVAGVALASAAASSGLAELSAGSVVQRIAFAVVVGLATSLARRTLSLEARRNDILADDSVQLERERLAAEQVAEALAQSERTVHATVLNTLTALERGGLSSDLGIELRLRCRESASVLRGLLVGSPTPADRRDVRRPLESRISREVRSLRDGGVRVDFSGREPHGWDPRRSAALTTATREAMSNVLRHAHASRVTVELSGGSGGALTAVIRDDGTGFDPAEAGGRFGVARAIHEPVQSTGGWVSITSSPGNGTALTLTWPPDSPLDQLPSESMVPGFTIPVLVLFGLFAFGTWAASMSTASRPGVNILAFAILSVVYVLLIRESRMPRSGSRDVLRTSVVVVSLVGGPLAYWLQHRALGVPPEPESSDWATFAVLAVFIALAAAGPRWAWAAAWGVWLVMQGDVVAELVSPGSAAILGAAIYGLTSRRNNAAYKASLARTRQEEAALTSAQAAVAAFRNRYAPVASSQVLDLLEGVASGRLDPNDPVVRDWAATEERFIRNVIRVDPRQNPLATLTLDVAKAARARGLLLETEVSRAEGRRLSVGADGKNALVVAVGRMRAGSIARLSCTDDSAGTLLRLVGQAEPGHALSESLPVVASTSTDMGSETDGTVMVEVRVTEWAAGIDQPV